MKNPEKQNGKTHIEINRRRSVDGIRGSKDRGVESREDRLGINQRLGKIKARNLDGLDLDRGKLGGALSNGETKTHSCKPLITLKMALQLFGFHSAKYK